MKQKAFRLEDDQIERLKSYAKAHKQTETEVIRYCIVNLGNDRQPQDNDETELVAELRRHISTLERETDRLSKALEDAQEATRAAQALHAAEKRQLALQAPEEAHTGRWERLKRAWRG